MLVWRSDDITPYPRGRRLVQEHGQKEVRQGAAEAVQSEAAQNRADSPGMFNGLVDGGGPRGPRL